MTQRTAAQRDALLDTHTAQITALQAALTKETADRKAGDTSIESVNASQTLVINQHSARLVDLDARLSALEAPVVVPPPVDPPPPVTGKSVTVSSVASLLAAVADDANDEVVLRNGSYTVGSGNSRGISNLCIDDRFRRTRPVLARAETAGGVTFDLGSASCHMAILNGACLIDWYGFRLANGVINQTGAFRIGGSDNAGLPAPHDMTFDKFWVLPSVRGTGSTAQGYARDHACYFGEAASGPTNFAFTNWDMDGAGGLAGGFQFEDHGNPGTPRNFTFKGFNLRNFQQALLLWRAIEGGVFDGGTIANSTFSALTFRTPGTVVVRNVTSTGSRQIAVDAPDKTGLTIEPSCSFA